MSAEIQETKDKSTPKTIYQYRAIVPKGTIDIIRTNLRYRPSQLIGIQYKAIGENLFDCIFFLNEPAESLEDERGTLSSSLSSLIKWGIGEKSWKNSDKIYSYKVHLENDRINEIKATKRPLPFIIEPSPELGENAYILYSYYSGELIVGALARNLIRPDSEKYSVLYGPDIDPTSLKALPELTVELTSQLAPSKQVEFTVSPLLTDRQDSKPVVHSSPSSPRLSFAPPPVPAEPLAAQSDHMSLEMKTFIGFICISIMGIAGYGFYQLLEKLEKIEATHEFFSNNYENILAGSGAAIAVLALIIYCKLCSEENNHDATMPNDVALLGSPMYPSYLYPSF